MIQIHRYFLMFVLVAMLPVQSLAGPPTDPPPVQSPPHSSICWPQDFGAGNCDVIVVTPFWSRPLPGASSIQSPLQSDLFAPGPSGEFGGTYVLDEPSTYRFDMHAMREAHNEVCGVRSLQSCGVYFPYYAANGQFLGCWLYRNATGAYEVLTIDVTRNYSPMIYFVWHEGRTKDAQRGVANSYNIYPVPNGERLEVRYPSWVALP